MKTILLYFISLLFMLRSNNMIAQELFQQRLTVITLGVENVANAGNFYEKKLGWKKHSSSSEGIIFYKLSSGVRLALYQRESLAEDAIIDSTGSGFKGFTLSYNVHTKDEVDIIIADLKGKNVKIVVEPREVFWGGYNAYFSDLDGNLWEVVYNPYIKMDEHGNLQE